MKTSLGIWALGPMITRFVPEGYQPEHTNEPTAAKVRRAVEGLGDLMDAYEFHYPGELTPTTSTRFAMRSTAIRLRRSAPGCTPTRASGAAV